MEVIVLLLLRVRFVLVGLYTMFPTRCLCPCVVQDADQDTSAEGAINKDAIAALKKKKGAAKKTMSAAAAAAAAAAEKAKAKKSSSNRDKSHYNELPTR